MNRIILFLAMSLLSVAGCKKKTVDTPPATMQPNTANSTWNYLTKTYLPTASTGSYTLKATDKDTLIGGRTYRIYTNSGGQNDYYSQSGTDYYQLGSIGSLSTQRVELLYLKDAAAGTTWSETQSITLTGLPTPVSVPLNYQIAEKGISYVVNSKTYTDVTHVKITLGAINISIGGFPIPLTQTSDLNFYYARGVGRIYSRTKITVSVPLVSMNISIDEELLLNAYTIQ